MKLGEIVKKYSWEEVEPIFLRLFPRRGNRTGFYRKMFEELQRSTLVESDVFISISHSHDSYESFTIKGYIPPSKRNIHIEIFPWEDWPGMNIDEEVTCNFSSEEIICFCLREMTSCGYTKETVQESRDEYEIWRKKDWGAQAREKWIEKIEKIEEREAAWLNAETKDTEPDESSENDEESFDEELLDEELLDEESSDEEPPEAVSNQEDSRPWYRKFWGIRHFIHFWYKARREIKWRRDYVKYANEKWLKTTRKRWHSLPPLYWLSKHFFITQESFKYFFEAIRSRYTGVYALNDYMQPVILKALKDYRQHLVWTKFYADIPELANVESLQKTLNELIFTFEKWGCDSSGDKNIDPERFNNGFRLFGKLFQYL
ncbi:MAG: hypothetical protein LBL13_00500 [Bacteroidales bacterium]|jgi:hypothetical protein|nr:hypothetical protein [Bacteroidales bacterium]